MALKDRLLQNAQIQAILNQAYGSLGEQGQAEFLKRPDMAQVAQAMQGENPMSFGQAMGAAAAAGGGGGGGGGGPILPTLLGAARAHPFKTAGLIASGMGNIGGLTDNDKIGGQIAGLGLGGLGAHLLASGNPYMAAMMTMGGGNLGALFDKLRARKELEEQQGYPNAAVMQR